MVTTYVRSSRFCGVQVLCIGTLLLSACSLGKPAPKAWVSPEGFVVGTAADATPSSVRGIEFPEPHRTAGLGIGYVVWPDGGAPKVYPDGSIRFATVYPVVDEVSPGGQAWEVGLRNGDEIRAVNGHDARQILNPFRDLSPGTRYLLLVRQNGMDMRVEFELAAPAAR